jgi:hypothetical protein
MIPDKKKTREEIAALREGLGIPDSIPQPGAPRQRPQQASPSPAAPAPQPAPGTHVIPPTDKLVLDPTHPDHPLPDGADEPVIHLDVVPLPAEPVKPEPKPIHTLRKHDLPLAPAPPVTHKTALPSHRHDPRDIAEIRKREALASLQQPAMNPAANLRKQTASPFLYVPGYLFAIVAAATAYQRFHHLTPIVLLSLSALIMIFIAARKPHSRHHAALLFILIFLTLAFGGLHYAPLFNHAP